MFGPLYTQLLELKELDNFIILTTREGGRGVDFKGKDVAYVVVAVEELTYSEML